MLMFAACPLVVFWGGAPLARRGRDEAARQPAPAPSVRRASLAVRDERRIVPLAWWLVVALLLDGAAAAVIASAAAEGALHGATVVAIATSFAVALSFAIAYGVWSVKAARAPQDLSGAREPEALERACDALRRSLARGVFGLMALCVAACVAVIFVALAMDGDPRQGAVLGILGGVGGSLVGIGGGVLGALVDRRRRAVLELGGTPPEPRFTGAPGPGTRAAERSAP